ncbi:MAG: DUF4198 domain-containing protein [Acidobacteria bacterium]|nr:DUF4198 domain-containing protein [Acidobacteriota bacterium]
MIPFLATLFLVPGSHELATPGPVSMKLPGSDYIHLRFKSLLTNGYWKPPSVKLPHAGTYWISAATKSVVRSIPAEAFNQLVVQDGLTMVEQYRKQYKQTGQPGRIVTSDFAKTMVTVGPPEPIQPVELNLPIEFILRYPQLVQLNFRGQPIEGVQVSLNGKPIGRTNGAGQLALPLLNMPSKLTATVVRVYPDQSTAPWEFFNASLTLPPLSQRQATIDYRELPGEELWRGEVKGDRVGAVIAGAEALGGRFAGELLEGIDIGFLEWNAASVNAEPFGQGVSLGNDLGLGSSRVNRFLPSLYTPKQ